LSAPRLCAASLGRLPAEVARPGYDRGALKTGVVHIGPGAFHRAHQAVAFDDLIARGDTRWGIAGASLRSDAAREALTPQDGLYTVEARDGTARRRRVIGALRGVIAAREDPGALIDALAAPETHIVTLTVTEQGYEAAQGAPAGIAGLLAQGLARRRAAGLPPFTAISCDNLPANGARLAALVLSEAARLDAGLADWIAARGAFPATMVDRIVPATEAADLAAFARETGVRDRALVKTEPFSQWVIEDRFAGERPDFESVGVRVAPSTAPWERAKLRLLNGAHSAMAYLGVLAGVTFVHAFVAEPARARFVEGLWDEMAATLDPPAALDPAAYRAALMARFANAGLAHRLDQIAIDGPLKLPQRLLSPLAERAARALASPAISLAVAGWIAATDGAAPGAAEDRVRRALNLSDALRLPLAPYPSAIGETAAWLAALDGVGAPACLRAAAAGSGPPWTRGSAGR
jgi:fructuronate reductase